MKVEMPCLPCFLNQALIAVSLVSDDPLKRKELWNLALDPVRDASLDDTPAHIATRIYRRLRAELNGADPFEDLKRRHTSAALALMRELEPAIASAPDPLEAAIRTSVAGNAIDLGIFRDVDLGQVFESIVRETFGVLSQRRLEADLETARDILFLADNAGELVCDRPLIACLLKRGGVKVAVKSVPVINDATLSDARASDLPSGVVLIENGSDCVGTILSTCSEAFQRAFDQADVIISKGQANFETLDTMRSKNIYFLFKAKCDVTAAKVGVPKDSLVAVSNRDFIPGH